MAKLGVHVDEGVLDINVWAQAQFNEEGVELFSLRSEFRTSAALEEEGECEVIGCGNVHGGWWVEHREEEGKRVEVMIGVWALGKGANESVVII